MIAIANKLAVVSTRIALTIVLLPAVVVIALWIVRVHGDVGIGRHQLSVSGLICNVLVEHVESKCGTHSL